MEPNAAVGGATPSLIFSIHEQDRAMIRESIVEAIIHSPDIIRTQLAICINTIIKRDFPGRWTQVVDKISIYLQSADYNSWAGALVCLYQLVKIYEYKVETERLPLNEAMNLLLPMIHQMVATLLNDPSDPSYLLQKQILKIFYAMTQFSLPLDLITREMFAQWMEVCRLIVDRPAPDSTHVDIDDRPDLPCWKVKKWATHILVRMFERYGSPGNGKADQNKDFAQWYLQTFTNGVLEVLLKALDQYRNKIYVSHRVLTDSLNYLKLAVGHAFSWALIKPHMVALIQDVVFPLMSFSESDQELWETDPYEYIRIKFDVYEDFGTPVPAAQAFLAESCKKRKGILQKTMQIVMEVVTHTNVDVKQKDGALHMVGTLADVLLKKKMYRDQMEVMLTTYVLPEFASPHGHMRARACWVLQYFCDIKLKNPQVLAEIMRLASNALLTDKELPVKAQAAIALQMFLTTQKNASPYIEPQIREITMEILTIIRETENEELTNVMQRIVAVYSNQLMPIAVEVCQHLATTFTQLLETDDGAENRAVTAMGLLNTMETLLSVMSEQQHIVDNMLPVVTGVIVHIFQESVMDFYEEACSLVYDLTAEKIPPCMWQMLELMYQVFQNDGFDYFVEMMPALHNFVTVDTEAFLSNPNHLLAIFNMCKALMTGGDPGEDPECHAAKLLEVIILQCKGRIDEAIPSIVEVALGRLTREVKSSELRTMCLQVVIAALYYNPQLLLTVLEKMQSQIAQPGSEHICAHFIRQWLRDADCFIGIHDRKLCVLGICTLISLRDCRPAVLGEVAGEVMPALIMLFAGLKRAYQSRAEELEEEEDETDDEDCEEALSSDEDDIDEANSNYLVNLGKQLKARGEAQGLQISGEIKIENGAGDIVDEDEDDDDDDDDDSEDMDAMGFDTYGTTIDDETNPETVDEYVVFQDVFRGENRLICGERKGVLSRNRFCFAELSVNDTVWYNTLMASVNQEQYTSIQEILKLADLKRTLKASEKIEKQGGELIGGWMVVVG